MNTKSRNAPSSRQSKIIVFIVKHLEADWGDFHPPLFPTMREIADAVGVSSTSTASLHINTLIRKGYIAARHQGSNRVFGITQKGMDYAKGVANGPVSSSVDNDSVGTGSSDVPVFDETKSEEGEGGK